VGDAVTSHEPGTSGARRGAILVTGMPRSGTTWLARFLATGAGTALTGREPMNARGRQYALSNTVPGWTRLQQPTRRQRRALRLSYAGLTPWVYSRYGRRQWTAPLPWTRVVVKDPFAMLSIPAVHAVTSATPVLLYRHPAAALASYRRMGWEPDLEELQPLVEAHQGEGHPAELTAQDLPRPGEVSGPEAMGRFWAALYTMALSDAVRTPGTIVVSHEEIAAGGEDAARCLFGALGLSWTDRTTEELSSGEDGEGVAAPSATGGSEPVQLHRLNRDPTTVARSWRAAVGDDDLEVVEKVTRDVRRRLDEVRLRLG